MSQRGVNLLENIQLGFNRGIQRIRFMFKLFLMEPLWFKILISITLFSTIVFSSSYFSDNPIYQSISKLAAAVFFGAYGFKMRRSRVNSIIFFILAGVCLYLALR